MAQSGLGGSLPAVYQHLIPREILEFQIHEQKANCAHCYMAFHHKKNEKRYDSKLKCCTYEPFLPNYLVGALFSDQTTPESTRNLLREKISKRKFALPVGMTAPVKYQLEYQQNRDEDFGVNPKWLCSYFDKTNNNCGIWRNRSAVCTSFFCVSDYGDKGKDFWGNLENYLVFVEMALVEEVMAHLDFSPRQVNECLDFVKRHEGKGWELSEMTIPYDVSVKLWNGYYNEQEEFYDRAFQFVQNFDKKSLQETMGEMGKNIEDQLFASMGSLNVNQ